MFLTYFLWNITLGILQLLWNYNPLTTMFSLSLTSSCPTSLHTLCKFQSVIVFFLLPFVSMSCFCVTSLVKLQSSVGSILCICTHAGEWGQGKIGNQTDKFNFQSWPWTSNARVPCFPSPFNLHFPRLFHTFSPSKLIIPLLPSSFSADNFISTSLKKKRKQSEKNFQTPIISSIYSHTLPL